MSGLSKSDIARLTALAGLLLPATEKLPAANAVAEFDALLAAALTASAIAPSEIGAALAALPEPLDWAGVRAFAGRNPAAFEALALIASGAYAMAPDVLNRLGFPADRRNPAGQMDAADEYETGILDPVLARGLVFRDPRGP